MQVRVCAAATAAMVLLLTGCAGSSTLTLQGSNDGVVAPTPEASASIPPADPSPANPIPADPSPAPADPIPADPAPSPAGSSQCQALEKSLTSFSESFSTHAADPSKASAQLSALFTELTHDVRGGNKQVTDAVTRVNRAGRALIAAARAGRTPDIAAFEQALQGLEEVCIHSS